MNWGSVVSKEFLQKERLKHKKGYQYSLVSGDSQTGRSLSFHPLDEEESAYRTLINKIKGGKKPVYSHSARDTEAALKKKVSESHPDESGSEEFKRMKKKYQNWKRKMAGD